MKRQVFYSFYYKPDNVRASQVRNMGVVEGNQSASDNDWESITGKGDIAIQKWIDDQLFHRSCSIVLIGESTANRKWINYEITKSWNDHKGVLGIYIHNLKDFNQRQSTKGKNPFDYIPMKNDPSKSLSSYVIAYDPPFIDSKQVYSYISQNILDWIEAAVAARA